MGKIIYKNMNKSETLHDIILHNLKIYELENVHITLEKNNKLFSMKASYGKYVVSKKDYDAYALPEKVLSTLKKQMKEYDKKRTLKYKESHEEDDLETELMKVKKFIIKPTNQYNAIEHMKLLGHKFYIYIDIDGKTNLLFEKDGEIFAQTSFETLSIEEAIVRVLDEDLSYIAFVNKENDIVTIAYKRRTGDIGIIDAEL